MKRHLRPGTNQLSIRLLPAPDLELQRQASHPFHVPSYKHMGSVGAYNFLRKPAFQHGWDFGPALPMAGIHGSVVLHMYRQPELLGGWGHWHGLQGAVLAHGSGQCRTGKVTGCLQAGLTLHVLHAGVHVQQDHSEAATVRLALECELLLPQVPSPGQPLGKVTASLPELGITVSSQVKADAQQAGSQADSSGGSGAAEEGADSSSSSKAVRQFVTLTLSVPRALVELWWPLGYGLQRLYELNVSYQVRPFNTRALLDLVVPGGGARLAAWWCPVHLQSFDHHGACMLACCPGRRRVWRHARRGLQNLQRAAPKSPGQSCWTLLLASLALFHGQDDRMSAQLEHLPPCGR